MSPTKNLQVESDSSSLAYSRLIVESCFLFCFLLIDPYSHLRHWLPFFPHQTKELKLNNFDYNFKAVRRRCVLDFKFTERRASKQPPLLFSMCTPTPAPARHSATLHATVLFHSVTARQVPPKRRFFLFFFFLLLRETTIFLLTRRSVTLPMCARGGTCVIDAPRHCGGRVFCT